MQKLLLLASLTISLVTILTQVAAAQSAKPLADERVPIVQSGVEDLPILETKVVQTGLLGASVLIKVQNKSEKPITYITLGSGDKCDFNGRTERTLVPAGAIYELSFHLSDILHGLPIRIGGVVYADGSIVGDDEGIKTLREQVERDRLRKDGVIITLPVYLPATIENQRGKPSTI